MKLSIVVAMGKGRVIGNAGKLPWYLPADLARFRALTLGHPVIMGMRTHQSIGRILPERTNIVLSYQNQCAIPGCVLAHTIDHAIAHASRENEEAFVIGGAAVYAETLPYARRLYVTMIDHEFPGDAYFPDIQEALWKLIDERSGVTNEKNPYLHRFLIFSRRD